MLHRLNPKAHSVKMEGLPAKPPAPRYNFADRTYFEGTLACYGFKSNTTKSFSFRITFPLRTPTFSIFGGLSLLGAG